MVSLRALLFFALSVAATAQTFQGNLAGVVSDASGGAIAGAAVTLENAATGLRCASRSETSGSFVFAELPPVHLLLQTRFPIFTLALKNSRF